MKNLFILAFILIIPGLINAQEKGGDMQTLFGGQELRSGGYGALELKGTQVLDEFGLMVGGRGGWIINSTFSIGGAGYGLTSTHTSNYITKGLTANEPEAGKVTYLRMGWGGFFFEYTNSSNSLLHFTANTFVGWGGASYTGNTTEMIGNDNDEGNKNWVYKSSGFFVVEPGVTAEVNVAKLFRVAVGASYRIVSGLDLPEASNSDLSGFSVNVAFKIGYF